MKKIICLDTSIASTNMGDHIIMESCRNQLKNIFEDSFIMNYPTHTPVSHFYQNSKKTSGGLYLDKIDFKFLCGTNLINANMFQPTPTWNVNIFNSHMIEDAICVGVGMGGNNNFPNLYTKALYKKVLSKKWIHSTRDERTATFLRSMGFDAINTGCATTWNLTDSHCKTIAMEKQESVVFTLTDYKKDVENDNLLIKTLLENYSKVYFWIQGIGDYEYFKSLYRGDRIIIVSPSINDYEAVLLKPVDYIGTRLHAGIKAMQKKRRSIIITVDNRTIDMEQDIGLVTINRSDIGQLPEIITTSIKTDVKIKSKNIKKWKEQFLDA